MNILIVTAHPDDESLWCPGLLKTLSVDNNILVTCLWGHLEKPDQFREKQFYQSCNYLCVKSFIHIDNTKSILSDIDLSKIDLVITHSPYGDEHEHRHHIWCYNLIKNLTTKNNIGFTYFSFITPMGEYRSMINTGYRLNSNIHLVNKLKTSYGPIFYQYEFDPIIKKTALSYYQNINKQVHHNGYYAWTSSIEGYMCLNQKAIDCFEQFNNNFTIPCGKTIF